MKKNVHPELHEITVRCACGNAFHTRSTAKELHVTICGKCHPFYTGAQKLLDTAGRIERFERRFGDKKGKK